LLNDHPAGFERRAKELIQPAGWLFVLSEVEGHHVSTSPNAKRVLFDLQQLV
jgi:hypothetical protein